MDLIESFLEYFGSDLKPHQIGRKYFLVDEKRLSISNQSPEYCGIFLGEQKGKHFSPSLALLELLESDKQIIIDDKAAWLFVCGKDIFKKSVIKGNNKKNIVLVYNKHKENLGYGKVVNKGDIFVKNILDRGNFLRRE